MKIILQRVKRASVLVDQKRVGEIGKGVLLLLGIHSSDNREHADILAEKCAELRIFEDQDGKMNLSLQEVNGAVLVVSQFTIYGDCKKGRRPNFMEAAPATIAEPLYKYFVDALRRHVPIVETGVFGAMMEVELVNDGPVTLILER